MSTVSRPILSPASCTSSGYTVRECSVCGERHIEDITNALPHSYHEHTIPATCDNGGKTIHLCENCGSSFVTDYTEPLGHSWDKGTLVTNATCTGEGVMEYHCVRCGYQRLDTNASNGHVPGEAATCTQPQLCTKCGAVIVNALGHDFKETVTPATCLKMGWTEYTCERCGESYKSDYTDALGHDYVGVITPPTCTEEGYTTFTCSRCGDSYVDDYTDKLGHAWDKGEKITVPTCGGEGVLMFRCERCSEHYLEAISPDGHTAGEEATCTQPQVCVDCGAVLVKALEHDFKAVVTPATCLYMGWTEYICENCNENYKSDYTDALGHDYIPVVTEPTCTEGGYTTFTCSRCGDSYVDEYTDKLGHAWDKGEKITVPTCGGEGVLMFRCERCTEHYLEAISPDGHTAGEEATCTQPQVCVDCGAVLVKALEHEYKAEIVDPTCTEMGYTVFTCEHCGDSYKGEYTDPAGHKLSDWITDKEPTTENDGERHKECLNCKEKLETETIEKLYNSATTDSKGEAVVGGYLVIVTDTKSNDPVANASVTLNKDSTISIRLPNSRLLDYAEQTTVTVLLTKDKSPVENMQIEVTDKNNNYCSGKTDKDGQITVPGTSGITGSDGNTTFGYTDADGNKYTITVKVEDYENGRPIEDATVTIGKTGTITVTLPDGLDIDGDNRIVVTVTDNNRKPLKDKDVIVKGDKDQESGRTDENGKLIVPEILRRENHGAYIYGYEDGTFRPEGDMTRAEAAAIFARLLAEEKGERISNNGSLRFDDVASDAWYYGYVRYLSNYDIAVGSNAVSFEPDRAITRAEFVAMAVRFFDAYGNGSAEIMEQYEDFEDVSDGYWAAEYIKDAAIHGWIKGYGDGSFRADDFISRAEVVTIVNRLLDRTADEEYIAENMRSLNVFPDVTKRHWAYLDVIEAANAHTAVFDGDGEEWRK